VFGLRAEDSYDIRPTEPEIPDRPPFALPPEDERQGTRARRASTRLCEDASEEGQRYLLYWFDTTGEEERSTFLPEALRRGGYPDKVDWLLGATEEELDRAIGQEGLQRLARDLEEEERRRFSN
jgi:hypothetical protein